MSTIEKEDSTSDLNIDGIAGIILEVNGIPTENHNSKETVATKLNGTPKKMRVDSGCNYVLIPEKDFKLIRTTKLIQSCP